MIQPATPATPTLDAFEAVLRGHDSATLALEEWCTLRGMAQPPRIVADRIADGGADATPSAVADHLKLAAGETTAMRHVRLRCGQTVLSVAWNWYVPARLAPEMITALQTGDTPFGKVVAPLRFRRQPLATVRGAAESCPADTITTHRAMLVLPDGRPIAYLIECYTAANLAIGGG